ncbi:MAG: 4'-phosphopantetheinyl transferase superfamily protein [Eubacteriales bacterium]|nr:4'-phosphopantetheinyl transferase superfamily protein [Eubacteriales bacterium]
MKAVIYYTDQVDQGKKKRAGHEEGELLLGMGLFREYGRRLENETREKGPHGKPYFSSCPWICYSITHSGQYAACAFAEIEIGLDIQIHREVNYGRMLRRMVPRELGIQMEGSRTLKEDFFRQWALREAYIKWTGEGLSRDLRTIPFDRGWHQSFFMDSDASGAIWAGERLSLHWEYVGRLSMT